MIRPIGMDEVHSFIRGYLVHSDNLLIKSRGYKKVVGGERYEFGGEIKYWE